MDHSQLHVFTGKEANKEERIRSNVKRSLNIFINGFKSLSEK